MTISYFTKANSQKLAYVHNIAAPDKADSIGVMFLGGYRSDMSGTKALFLEEKCKQAGMQFLRFDYRGHGISDGAFEDGTIGAWFEDALEIFDHVAQGKMLLVGSSMGGWIALLLMLARPERVAKLVGIAAAPDFTHHVQESLSDAQRQELHRSGKVILPPEAGDDIFTQKLLEEGENHLLLHQKHSITTPIILLQGQQDPVVPWQTALKIRDCFQSPHCEIAFIKDGDHRLSRPQDLALLWEKVQF